MKTPTQEVLDRIEAALQESGGYTQNNISEILRLLSEGCSVKAHWHKLVKQIAGVEEFSGEE